MSSANMFDDLDSLGADLVLALTSLLATCFPWSLKQCNDCIGSRRMIPDSFGKSVSESYYLAGYDYSKILG